MSEALIKLAKACFDLIYPLRCASCKRKIPSELALSLCPACFAAVKKSRPPVISGNFHFDRAYSLFLYEGPVKALIHELKYRGKEHLGDALGELMAGFVQESGINLDFIDCIVPVPLHRVKLREREFNQALLLAQKLARLLGKPLESAALARKRNTASQTGLQQETRLSNVAGAFSAREACVSGRNILLVDDVFTTGATASEAARALKEAGAISVYVLTLAH